MMFGMETNITKQNLKTLSKVGVQKCIEAAEMYREGNGCNTIGFCLSLHWKTASAAIEAGLKLPVVR